METLDLALGLSVALFVIGFASALVRRGLVPVLIGIEFMLAAGNVALLAFAREAAISGRGDGGGPAQLFVWLVLTVSVAQMAVGLGVLIAFHRNRNSLETSDVSLLRW